MCSLACKCLQLDPLPCSLNPKTAAALQQQSHRDGAVLAHQTQCSACPWRCMKRAKRDHAIRAVQGTQLPAELRGSHAEDLPEALPPPVQPFAVILGAGPTGAFMVSTKASTEQARCLLPSWQLSALNFRGVDCWVLMTHQNRPCMLSPRQDVPSLCALHQCTMTLIQQAGGSKGIAPFMMIS